MQKTKKSCFSLNDQTSKVVSVLTYPTVIFQNDINLKIASTLDPVIWENPFEQVTNDVGQDRLTHNLSTSLVGYEIENSLFSGPALCQGGIHLLSFAALPSPTICGDRYPF